MKAQQRSRRAGCSLSDPIGDLVAKSRGRMKGGRPWRKARESAQLPMHHDGSFLRAGQELSPCAARALFYYYISFSSLHHSKSTCEGESLKARLPSRHDLEPPFVDISNLLRISCARAVRNSTAARLPALYDSEQLGYLNLNLNSFDSCYTQEIFFSSPCLLSVYSFLLVLSFALSLDINQLGRRRGQGNGQNERL